MRNETTTKNVYQFLLKVRKSWNVGEFTKLVPETESQNREDHEFWNHEMWGSPVIPIVKFAYCPTIVNN